MGTAISGIVRQVISILFSFKSLEKDLESLDKQNQAKEHNLREYMANYQ